MQSLHAALLAFSAPLASLQPRGARGGAISASALNDDWATPLEVATKKSMRHSISAKRRHDTSPLAQK